MIGTGTQGSATEVRDLLDGWEERLEALGAPCVAHLRPGLTRAAVNEIAEEYGLRLADDAAAVWMWHDGDRLRYEDDWGRPSLTPSGMFLSLRASLERSRWLMRITEGDDEDTYSDEDAETELYFRPGYVILSENENPLYLDVIPTVDNTPTALFLSHDSARAPRLPLAERVRLWHRALDLGLWAVGSSGDWVVDETKAPDESLWWLLYT